jgi:hypothetical protein|tara:strand:- start:904 stop:1194 length:291 start_codon:yes stop_codon:yes gene_type:complete
MTSGLDSTRGTGIVKKNCSAMINCGYQININRGKKMTTEEMIESIQEFINDTKECMADTPSQGIAGTILQPHHILKQQIREAEELLAKIDKGGMVK